MDTCEGRHPWPHHVSHTNALWGRLIAIQTPCMQAVDEYLQFHFGADKDILPYENGPQVSTHATLGGTSTLLGTGTCCTTHGCHHDSWLP